MIVEFYRDTLSGSTYWIVALVSIIFIMALIGYNLERLGKAELPPKKEKKPEEKPPIPEPVPVEKEDVAVDNTKKPEETAQEVYDFSSISENATSDDKPIEETQSTPEILELTSDEK